MDRMFLLTGTEGSAFAHTRGNLGMIYCKTKKTMSEKAKNKLADEAIDEIFARREINQHLKRLLKKLGPHMPEKVVRPLGTLHYVPDRVYPAMNRDKIEKGLKKLGLSANEVDEFMEKNSDLKKGPAYLTVTNPKSAK